MRGAFQWIAVAIGLVMAGCATAPAKQKVKISILPRLASLYAKQIKYENGLPARALDPSKWASDDPYGYFGGVIGYETRMEQLESELKRQLDWYFPDPNYLTPAQMAEKRELLDELQKRFGISLYAMYKMAWSSDQIIRYIRRHYREYGMTRIGRFYMYPEKPRKKG